MMNLIGKWSVAQLLQYDDEKGMIWMDAADILAKEDNDKESLMMLNAIALFEEDGNLSILSPLPEGVSQEEIDEALAAGEITMRDGLMVTGQNHWKVENGKNMADTGMEGEVLGEKVGPWEEIKEIDGDMIEFSFFHFKKME